LSGFCGAIIVQVSYPGVTGTKKKILTTESTKETENRKSEISVFSVILIVRTIVRREAFHKTEGRFVWQLPLDTPLPSEGRANIGRGAGGEGKDANALAIR
jgi:hypothetical protein